MPSGNKTSSRIVYISWAQSCSRSDHVARELGGESFMIYLASLGSHPATILFKYFGQFWMTLWRLIRTRPSAVFVMSPPVIAVLPVYLYCLVTRTPFVMDCHTAAFLHPRWKRLQWLQHWLERRAATNIVHNAHLAGVVQEHGGATTLVSDVPVIYEGGEQFDFQPGFCVAAVCSFNPDEPIEAIFEAAQQLPDVRFYMTGNAKHLSADIAEKRPENVTLTGFISDEAYGDLISRAGAVMSLTTRDHTMLRGAWEAVYQGTPVIISDWPILKESFPEGSVHVDNTSQSIASAVETCRDDPSRFRAEAEQAREKRHERWRLTKRELLRAIGHEHA